jgi:hypothetical protein
MVLTRLQLIPHSGAMIPDQSSNPSITTPFEFIWRGVVEIRLSYLPSLQTQSQYTEISVTQISSLLLAALTAGLFLWP